MTDIVSIVNHEERIAALEQQVASLVAIAKSQTDQLQTLAKICAGLNERTSSLIMYGGNP